jgi:hypothetical protein
MRRERPFLYENMWQRHELYDETVRNAWNGNCNSLADVQAALGGTKNTLKSWDRHQFGSVRKELANLRRQLEEIRRNNLNSGPSIEERSIARRLAEILSREEIMEKQRSRVKWLQEGDRNTAFFKLRLDSEGG